VKRLTWSRSNTPAGLATPSEGHSILGAKNATRYYHICYGIIDGKKECMKLVSYILHLGCYRDAPCTLPNIKTQCGSMAILNSWNEAAHEKRTKTDFLVTVGDDRLNTQIE
jgi:hypothetical protein